MTLKDYITLITLFLSYSPGGSALSSSLIASILTGGTYGPGSSSLLTDSIHPHRWNVRPRLLCPPLVADSIHPHRNVQSTKLCPLLPSLIASALTGQKYGLGSSALPSSLIDLPLQVKPTVQEALPFAPH